MTLSCVGHANPPASRYAWYRILGDQVLAKGPFQNLTFPSVRSQHGGQYYCTASNRLGSQTSAVASLSVLCESIVCRCLRLVLRLFLTFSPVLFLSDPPKNTSVLARPSSVVDAGRPLTLTCISQANPPVDNITWHRLAVDGGSAQS